jgi:methylphosphotriester-DNA--protein-cysteine methyltransferase
MRASRLAGILGLLAFALIVAVGCEQNRAARNEAQPVQTVYVTRTGACYHRLTCRYAWAGSRPISHAEALRRGLRPCKVCRPGP